MNKRQKMKNDKKRYLTMAFKIDIAEEMKRDSVAHLIKSYFTIGEIHNKEMFKYNRETGKVLVSKKALNHILKMSGCAFLDRNFDFEFVDEINPFGKEK